MLQGCIQGGGRGNVDELYVEGNCDYHTTHYFANETVMVTCLRQSLVMLIIFNVCAIARLFRSLVVALRLSNTCMVHHFLVSGRIPHQRGSITYPGGLASHDSLQNMLVYRRSIEKTCRGIH